MIHSLLQKAILFWTTLLVSCAGGGSSDCRFGQPKPIFSDQLSGITEHRFEAKGQQAQERLRFSNGLALELLQSGCNSIQQEFRFLLLPSEEPVAESVDWLGKSAELLQYLSSLSEEHMGFAQWAQIIESQKSQLKLGQQVEVQPHIFVMVDRIKMGNENLLIVELSQQGPDN